MTERVFYSRIRHKAQDKGICYIHGRDNEESSYHEFYWPFSNVKYVAQITRSPIPGNSWWFIYQVDRRKNGGVMTIGEATTDENKAVEYAFFRCINE